MPTQLGRTFAELGIGSITARSPQAKGRVERLWGTLQDRLVAELRLAGIEDRDGANAFLRPLPRPAQPPLHGPGRRSRAGLAAVRRGAPGIERVCCFKYRRTVARDGTVRAGATTLQLPAKANGRSRAGQPVELHVRLDGRLVVRDGQRELVTTPAPLDAVQLRALAGARVEVGEMPRSAANATTYRPDHPWRRPGGGSRLHAKLNTEKDGVNKFTEQLADRITEL